jgi:Plavaka transposase
MAPDLLHQIIKGTLKDHFVEWVDEYLVAEHGGTRVVAIMADIDRQ